ncbi:hypothetical protein T492DRAFT_912424 [Pavlovales sp. CCMP2436]|nr:hypothetical protein T492DRAFT_912424 [Pavlovales sp. CCMP2436]
MAAILRRAAGSAALALRPEALALQRGLASTPAHAWAQAVQAPLAGSVVGRRLSAPAAHAWPRAAQAPLRAAAPSRSPLVGSVLGRWLSRSGSSDLYSTLGVDRRATVEEIKRGYYAQAKKNHPDVNPSAAGAARFRQVAEAYEVLRDPVKRRSYDLGGFRTGAAQQQASGGPGDEEVDPMHVFRTVWRDFGLDDIELYLKRVTQEGTEAFDAAARTQPDFKPAKKFATDHAGLIITTVVPLLLILRYPAAAFTAARGGLVFGLAIPSRKPSA